MTRKQGFTWSMNPEFLDMVKARFAPEDTILVTCRSGGRAAMAINMMAAAGYTKAYNILDGMEGDEVKDPDSVFDGMRRKNGWVMSGLPWTYELDPATMAVPKKQEIGELQLRELRRLTRYGRGGDAEPPPPRPHLSPGLPPRRRKRT